MQKQPVLFSIIILMSLFVGCISMPSAQPVEPEAEPTDPIGVSPTEPASLRTASTNPYLGCLSPALTMNAQRASHTATRLPDGNVLIAGGFRQEGTSEIAIASAELFDSGTSTFTPTNDMNETRSGHTATLLPNGQVLLVGGWNESSRSSTAELYDPQTGTFEYTGSLMAPRQGMTATPLLNDRVLIAGGDSARNIPQPTAELYDPATKTFTPTGNLNGERIGHTATLLPNGKVLLVGGTSGNDNILATAELYDPETGQFTPASSANAVRYKHTAVLLEDGNVLILGGSDHQDWNGKYNSAEIYDVKTGTFTETSTMNQERFKLADAAVLLPDGNVLIGGGNRQIEIFDVQSQDFVLGDILDEDYYYSVLTPLNTGSVLITGGYNGDILPSDKAWLHCG